MKAVVLLSGGQDSTTCLYWTLDKLASSDRVAAVAIDYGQRHRIELALAEAQAARAGIPFTVLPLHVLKDLGAASLTNAAISNDPENHGERNTWADERGLPQSFVPGRNLLFFTLAAAWGVPRGYSTLVTGVCQQDEAGYPDCREETVVAMMDAIRAGFGTDQFWIQAPLLHKSKAETWELAADLGVLDLIVEGTHTCYEGDRSELHSWGFGCGECGACVERRKGFEAFSASRVA